jgi:hypothetical protein
MGSSAELGMPRNEHFLPRNNGNRSESIPRNFFGTKFRSQPYLQVVGQALNLHAEGIVGTTPTNSNSNYHLAPITIRPPFKESGYIGGGPCFVAVVLLDSTPTSLPSACQTATQREEILAVIAGGEGEDK